MLTLLVQAQVQKGESIYSTYTFASNQYKPNANGRTVYSRVAIGHVNPKPFIAFSCRWKDVTATKNVRIAVRFSTADNKNDGDVNGSPNYITIKKDGHFENENGENVSELLFIDKKYTHYELKLMGTSNSDGKLLGSLMLNFFNPNGVAKPNKILDNNMLLNNIKLPNNGNATVTNETSKQLNADENLQPTACPCPLPNYVTRTQWGCPQGQGLAAGVGTSTTVTHLIVHHSDGANTSADWGATVLSIWNYHVGTNGWSDIGYNWLIAPNGVLYEGRGSNNLLQNVTGAHFCGFNANTMGTCMLGNYTSNTVTDPARTTLIKTLAWKACNAGIPVIGTALHASSGLTLNRISGHRDGCATDCPGTQFYNTFGQLRQQTDSAITSCNAVAPCTASLNIAAIGCPTNNITFSPTSVQNGGTTPTYTWYLNNVYAAAGNTYTLTNAVSTDKVYARMVSNAACATTATVNSDTIQLSCIVTTAVVQVDGLQYCNVSPNPNNGRFVVNMHLNKAVKVGYKLSSIEGKLIAVTDASKVIGTVQKTFSHTNLANGIYLLEILFDTKKVTYKLIVSK